MNSSVAMMSFDSIKSFDPRLELLNHYLPVKSVTEIQYLHDFFPKARASFVKHYSLNLHTTKSFHALLQLLLRDCAHYLSIVSRIASIEFLLSCVNNNSTLLLCFKRAASVGSLCGVRKTSWVPHIFGEHSRWVKLLRTCRCITKLPQLATVKLSPSYRESAVKIPQSYRLVTVCKVTIQLL